MSNNNIPEKTIERLSEYRRTLMNLHRQGITHIFSHVLAEWNGGDCGGVLITFI